MVPRDFENVVDQPANTLAVDTVGAIGGAGAVENAASADEPTTPVRFGFQFSLFLANVAGWLFAYPLTTLLLPRQAQLIDPAHKELLLSIIVTGGAIVGIVINPLAGILSDRTRGPLGRRRPWILGGLFGAVLGLALLAQAQTVALFVASAVILSLFANAIQAAMSAIIPDKVPVRQRGAVSGWVGLATPVSLLITAILVPIVISATGGKVGPSYYVIIALVVIILIPYGLFLPDKTQPTQRTAVERVNWLQRVGVDLRRNPDFGYAWITRFLLVLGFNIGTGYLLYYLTDVVQYGKVFPGHDPAEGVGVVQIISVAGLLLITPLAGIISDRIRRRKALVIAASALIALGLLVLTLFHTWTAVLVSAGLQGAGFGAYLSVDAALVTQVLPDPESRAKDLAIINVAGTLGILLAPGIAYVVVAGIGLPKSPAYTILFGVAAVLTALSAILVQPIKSVR